jgi:DNA-binding transcriptional LysR family regulator
MRSLNLDQLRAFVEVVERGSFTAAARELNLTQPAVTHQIQELERRFKVALVERFGKRAYLTQAGEKLIEHARNLLEEDSRTQVMMRRFGDGWLGRVRVGTSMTVLMYLLPPILRQLKTDHPQLEINLKACRTATTLQMLKTNALDLGLCAMPIEDPAFETVPLFKDELVAILPAKLGHVPKRVTPAFLSRCPLILGNEESALRRTIIDWLAVEGPPPRPLMEFDNVEAIKSVVAVGLGASIVPNLSLGAGHVAAANMLVRPLNPGASRRVGLVRLRGKRATEGMELVSAALLSLRRIDLAGEPWRISLNSGRLMRSHAR